MVNFFVCPCQNHQQQQRNVRPVAQFTFPSPDARFSQTPQVDKSWGEVMVDGRAGLGSLSFLLYTFRGKLGKHWSSLLFKTSADGATTAFTGNWFHVLTALQLKAALQKSSWNDSFLSLTWCIHRLVVMFFFKKGLLPSFRDKRLWAPTKHRLG